MASNSTAGLIAFVTVPSLAVGRRIARAVVGERLAACVNLLPPLESVFIWEGRLDRARERLLILKTTRAAWPALRRRIAVLHPYDVPEIIAVPITAGLPAYLRWVQESTRHSSA